MTIGPIKVGGPPAGSAVSDPAPQFTRADNLGGVITLIGYDLELERKAVKLVLYWRCEAPITDDYTTFIHVMTVEGQQEAMVAQMDHPPSDGAYPTSLWDAGEIVRDAFHIPLPPETPQGNFEIAVGLYEPATGTRLPVAGSSDGSIRLTGEMPPSD